MTLFSIFTVFTLSSDFILSQVLVREKILAFISFCVGVVSRRMCDVCSSLQSTPSESLSSVWPTINVVSLGEFRPQSGTSGSSHNKANAFDCYHQPWGTLAHIYTSAHIHKRAHTHTQVQRYRIFTPKSWCSWKPYLLSRVVSSFALNAFYCLDDGRKIGGGGVLSFCSPFEVNVFWLTVLLSFSLFDGLFFPSILLPFIVSFSIKVHLFERSTASLLCVIVKYCCIRGVSAYLGGFERIIFNILNCMKKLLSFIPFRSPEGLDSQPPALPPKQLSRKTLSQIIQAHSQQSLLDNHVNEMYDVPVKADKTTVSHFER